MLQILLLMVFPAQFERQNKARVFPPPDVFAGATVDKAILNKELFGEPRSFAEHPDEHEDIGTLACEQESTFEFATRKRNRSRKGNIQAPEKVPDGVSFSA